MMEEAERTLDKDKKDGKRQYELVDRKVKNFLEQVWLERSRWIGRMNDERRKTREALEEERRRTNGLMRWLNSTED